MLTKYAIDYLMLPQHNTRIAVHYTDEPVEAEDFLMHLLTARARIKEIRHEAAALSGTSSTA